MLLGQMHGTMTNRGTIWRVGRVQVGGEGGGSWGRGDGEWLEDLGVLEPDDVGRD